MSAQQAASINKALVGKTKDAAREAAANLGFRFRVTREDGVDYIGTCDFRRDRVNVHVVNGLVTGATIG